MLKVVGLNDRRVERVVGPELNEAAALWSQQCWKQETSVAEMFQIKMILTFLRNAEMFQTKMIKTFLRTAKK